MKKDIITSAIGILVLTLLLGIVYPLVVTGRQPGRVPGQRQRPEGLRRRQARRLEDHRPALRRRRSSSTASRRSTRTATRSPPRTRATSRAGRRRPSRPTTPPRPRSRTSAPTASRPSRRSPPTSRPTSALEKPYDPGLTAAQGPGRRGQQLGVGDRPGHLGRERRHPGPPDRGGPAPVDVRR